MKLKFSGPKIIFLSFILTAWILNFVHLLLINNTIIYNNTYNEWISGVKAINSLQVNGTSTPFIDSGQGLNIYGYILGSYRDTYLSIDFANLFIQFSGIDSAIMAKIIYIIIMFLFISPSILIFKKFISGHVNLAYAIIIILFCKQIFLNSQKIGIGFSWPFSSYNETSFFQEVKTIVGLLFAGTPSMQFIGQNPRNITLFIICVSFLLLYFRPGINLFVIMFPTFYVDFYMAIFGFYLLLLIQWCYLFKLGIKFIEKKFIVTNIVNTLILLTLWVSFSLFEGVFRIFFAIILYFSFIYFKKYYFEYEIDFFDYVKFLKSLFLIMVPIVFMFFAVSLYAAFAENHIFGEHYLTSAFAFESLPRSLFIFGYFIQILLLIKVKRLILIFFTILRK